MFSIDDNDACEAEVDGCGEESRRDCEANEVDEEVVSSGVEGILVKEDSSDVAYNLAGEAKEHSCHVSPGSMVDAEDEIEQDVDPEDCSIKGVAAKGGDIVEMREGQVAESGSAKSV